MSRVARRSAPTALLAAALIALIAGCGSDSSGETAASAPATTLSIPTPTSPIPTASTPSTTTGGGKEKGQTTSSNGGVTPGACSIPDAYGNFKYAGLDCTAAVAVATAWDQDGKDQARHPLRRALRRLHAGWPVGPVHLAAGVGPRRRSAAAGRFG